MSYYDTFLNLHNINSQDYYVEDQEIVNEDFENSPTFHDDILQEVEFGTLEFKQIKARIVKIVDSKVGDRINDDYRKIIFPTNSFKPQLGSRYKFDNNIWIVYSTNNIKSLRSACYLRRCNNTINVQDKYGNIHSEPCIIDVKPTKSGIQEQEYMSVPIARQILMYQYNDWTKDLFINSRIMFNRQVYKIGSIMELNRTETFDADSIHFVKCYVDNDLKNEYDNEELQIADYKQYNYAIDCNDSIKLSLNSKGNIYATVNIDGEITEEPLNWSSMNSDIININKNTGEYLAKSIGSTTIRVGMVNKPTTFKDITVEITSTDEKIYKNVISPQEFIIPLGSSQKYEVYELLNDERIDTTFNIVISAENPKKYKFLAENNSFVLTNINQVEEDIVEIICTNNRDMSSKKVYIELGGLF